MKSPLSLCGMTAVAAVLGYSLILPDAGKAQGAASGEGSRGNYELLTPQGAGPFPAVIVMHPCNGVNDNTRRWAGRLVGWGYAALIVDSFRSRGLSNVCGNGGALPASVSCPRRNRSEELFEEPAQHRKRSNRSDWVFSRC
jgi:dienelactone hydrolase